MLPEDEINLLRAVAEGKPLLIDCAAVVALPSQVGATIIILAMVSADGERFMVPLSRDLALMLGDQMVRAVDAIDAGLAKFPTPPSPANQI
jgi:hypothetical protein